MGKTVTFLAGAGLALALTVTSLAAQQLQRFDMAQMPLTEINLKGGSYTARLLDARFPFKSQLLIACQDCGDIVDALVGLLADTDMEGPDLAANPEAFLAEYRQICNASLRDCTLKGIRQGDLRGYAYVARLEDGATVVERVYFSNGLKFIVNASAADGKLAETNVALLTQAVLPYVTGQKP